MLIDYVCRLSDAQFEEIKQSLAKMNFDKLEEEIHNKINKQVIRRLHECNVTISQFLILRWN